MPSEFQKQLLASFDRLNDIDLRYASERSLALSFTFLQDSRGLVELLGDFSCNKSDHPDRKILTDCENQFFILEGILSQNFDLVGGRFRNLLPVGIVFFQLQRKNPGLGNVPLDQKIIGQIGMIDPAGRIYPGSYMEADVSCARNIVFVDVESGHGEKLQKSVPLRLRQDQEPIFHENPVFSYKGNAIRHCPDSHQIQKPFHLFFFLGQKFFENSLCDLESHSHAGQFQKRIA